MAASGRRGRSASIRARASRPASSQALRLHQLPDPGQHALPALGLDPLQAGHLQPLARLGVEGEGALRLAEPSPRCGRRAAEAAGLLLGAGPAAIADFSRWPAQR